MPDTVQLAPNLHAATPDAGEIPVIDLARWHGGNPQTRQATAEAIGAACRHTGFFYVVNHGVPAWLTRETFAQTARFFAQTPAQKSAIAIENSTCHRGWFTLGAENLDPASQTAAGDLKEGVKIGRDLPATHPLIQANTPLHGPNQWPPNLPGWREAMQAYYAAMEALGRQLMHAFAAALSLPESYFDSWLTAPMTTLSPLHYPPQTGAITPAQIGAGAHSDYGCLTILAQDAIGGLQVRSATGQWLAAPPIEDSFVINIGDMMERWTNGVFTSTLHRVVNASGRERYSLPFFFDPDFETPVACLETCQQAGPKFPPTTAGQHLLDKINASFSYHREKRHPS